MNRAKIDQICSGLPGAEFAHPADGALMSWKLAGKMFVHFDHNGVGMSVKTPDVETAAVLIEAGRANRARYFHKSWVHIPWDLVDEDEARDRVLTSYRIIRSALSKKAQADLGPF
jgi:predicted DNA-binding protein (MmcQ/YjbR family)